MSSKNLSVLLTIGGAVKSTLSSAFRRTSSGLDDVGKAIRKAKEEQARLAAEMAKMSRNGPAQIGHLQAAYQALTAQLTTLAAKQAAIRASEERHAARLEKRGRMRNGAVGAGLALGAEAAGVGALVRNSSEFNSVMTQVGVTAETNGAEVKSMGDFILQTSRDTKQSAKEVRSAQGFLVAAGLELGTSQRLLVSVGRTATAATAEITDVARAAFTLNDALGVKPEGMQDALDVLVKAGKLGNFEFKAMAKNLPALGASFGSLKLGGLEGAATLGAALQIARKGAGDEDEAANNMRNYLAKVNSPEVLKKAKKMGVDLYAVMTEAQAKGENPFEASIAAVQKLTKGGDLKLLGELFGDMQVQNFLKPMLQNLEEYKRIKAEALKGKGTVDRDFAIISKTSAENLESVSDAAYELSVRLGTALEPVIVGLTSVVVPMVRGLADWANENPRLAATVVGVVVGATALTAGIFALGFASTFIVPGLAALGTAVTVVRTAVMGLSAAMWANPVGAVIAGIIAVGAAAYMVYKHWEPIKAFFSGIWDGITAGAKASFEWIAGRISWVGDKFRDAKRWLTGESAVPPSLPPVPPMATASAGGAGAGRGGAGGTHNYNVSVTAAPGQSTTQVAGAVVQKLGAQGAKLGALHDQPDW